MGIRDEVRSATTKLKEKSSLLKPRAQLEASLTALTSAGSNGYEASRATAVQKTEEYVPDPRRRKKIGRILTGLGRFAVESAVNEPFKGVAGGIQVYKIVQEGLKDEAASNPPTRCNSMTKMMEEMHSKMDKMEKEMNIIKEEDKLSNQHAKGLETPEDFPKEANNGSSPAEVKRKKIFIRSRL